MPMLLKPEITLFEIPVGNEYFIKVKITGKM